MHFGPKTILIYLGLHELDRLHVVTDTLSQSLLLPELRGDPCKLQPTIQGIDGVGGAKENNTKTTEYGFNIEF